MLEVIDSQGRVVTEIRRGVWAYYPQSVSASYIGRHRVR